MKKVLFIILLLNVNFCKTFAQNNQSVLESQLKSYKLSITDLSQHNYFEIKVNDNRPELLRNNFREIKRRDKRDFHQLFCNGVSFDLLIIKQHELPLQIKVGNRELIKIKTSNPYQVEYQSQLKDSQIYKVIFGFDEFYRNNPIKSIKLKIENVRTGESKDAITYQLYDFKSLVT